jgi:hypothetical protein
VRSVIINVYCQVASMLTRVLLAPLPPLVGMVTADLAPAYFEAWRVWSSIDCSRHCLMGSGTAECATLPANWRATVGCSGELALTAHLCKHAAGRGELAEKRCAASGKGRQAAAVGRLLTWRRITRKPGPFFLPAAGSNVSFAKRPQKFTFAAASKMFDMLEYHPVHGMCKPCGTGCLSPLRRTPRALPLKKLKVTMPPPRTLSCATDYESDVCLYLGQERDTSCQARQTVS